MNTLKISVKSDHDAALLMKLLKSLNFVVHVEPVLENKNEKRDQYEILKNLLDKMADKKLFPQITDPVGWQKDLRDEWA